MDPKLDILAMAAHPDDIEMSCAGTLIKHTRKGQQVGIVDLTRGELGTRGSVEIREREAKAAAEIMGISVRENADLPDGFFQNTEAAQRKLIVFIRRFRPEIVIANALADRHPDHRKGGRLIADACYYAGLAKIETEHNGEAQKAWRPKRVFHVLQDRFMLPNFIVDISDSFEQKLQAIKAYKSQFHDPSSNEPMTYIASQNFLEQLRHRDSIVGKLIGGEYAEGFQTENIPGIHDLDSLYLPAVS